MRYTAQIEPIKKRWVIRRAFENAQDASLVAKSLRDIVILLNVFQVSRYGGCVKKKFVK